MKGLYRFAGVLAEVSTLGNETHALCAPYCAEGAAAFAVETGREDIELEREKSAREDEREGRPVRRFPDGYLETLAVCRLLAEKLPAYGALLVHGSCVAVDGKAYLFTAKSGVGKSTHARLWRELLGSRAEMVNDDKPFLRVTESDVLACGSPWDGKHRLSANVAVPLRGICLLSRAAENEIRHVTAAEAYPTLLQQCYRPADAAALRETLALLDRITGATPLWRLGCNMELSAARLAFETMSAKE